MTQHQKTLDANLSRIRSMSHRPADLIIADTRDGDMAPGMGAPGPADAVASRHDAVARLDRITDLSLEEELEIIDPILGAA